MKLRRGEKLLVPCACPHCSKRFDYYDAVVQKHIDNCKNRNN